MLYLYTYHLLTSLSTDATQLGERSRVIENALT